MSTFVFREDDLSRFIKSLKPKLRAETTNIDKACKKEKNKTWDYHARHIIGEKMEKWFKEYFRIRELPEPWKHYFGYEAEKNKLPRTKIFSSFGCYPDMYFHKPVKMAIELDHGRTGSKLKSALGKAGFNKLSRDWERVCVVFFDESRNKEIEKSQKIRETKKIIDFYRDCLSTEILIV